MSYKIQKKLACQMPNFHFLDKSLLQGLWNL